MNNFIRLLLLSLLVSLYSWSAEIKGIVFPNQTEVQGKQLELNGVGVRQKTIFNVDVYVAGLYLTAPTRDVGAIYQSEAPKHVVLVFLRDATAKQIQDSWNEGFQKNCHSNCEPLMPMLTHLDSAMTDVKKGQEIGLTFLPSGMTIASQGQVKTIPTNHDFSNMMLATFLGPKGRPDNLNKGLLGEIESGKS